VRRREAGRISIRLATHLSVCSFPFRMNYGPKGKEVTEGWRKLHNEDLHNLYPSKVKVNQSHYRPEVPRGFQEFKVPRLRDNGAGRW